VAHGLPWRWWLHRHSQVCAGRAEEAAAGSAGLPFVVVAVIVAVTAHVLIHP
jgi:hypothetical protein